MAHTEHFVESNHQPKVCSLQTKEEIILHREFFISNPTRLATAGSEGCYYQALIEFDKDDIATHPSRAESMLKILLLILNFLVVGLVLYWFFG